MSLIIAHLIGIYFVVLGLLFVVKPRTFVSMMQYAFRSPWMVYLSAGIELVLGVLVVMTFDMWATGYEVVMAIIGWVMVVESAAYLFLPLRFTKGVVRGVNKPVSYVLAGAVLIMLGVYLMFQSGVLIG